ncbi:MAG TPA: hypothetical protein VGG56_10245 [Terracidiphilus sp.]|jgi:hypothetical protein
MANFTPVNPGDLITAAFFNQVLGSFDSRISALEASLGASSGAIVITGLSPAGPLHMGDTLTVLGQNFGMPSEVTVTVGGVAVNGSSFLPGSGNNALVFQIPPVQGIPPQGQLVNLVVSNPNSAAPPYPFTLLPYVLTIPTGQVLVNMTGAPGVGTITAGNSYNFTFTLTSSTSLADVYSLTATLDANSTAAGWSATPVDGSGNALKQISIAQGQNTTTTVTVSVKVPAEAAAGSTAQVTLTVTSQTNSTGLVGSGSTAVTVGGAPPPVNTIAIAIAGVAATGLAGATNQGNTSITLPHGATSAVVALSVLVPDTASSAQYTCTGPSFGAPTWAGSVPGTDSPFFGQTNSVLVHVNITAIPAGPSSTTMTLSVQETGKAANFGQITPTINVL